MQTPLQKLIEQFEEKEKFTAGIESETIKKHINLAKSLLPYEEQVIKDAYNVGYNNGYLDTALKPQEYYNERFNQIK